MTGSIYINPFSCFSCNGLHLVSKEENIKDKQHIKAKLRNLDNLGSEDITSPSSNSPEYVGFISHLFLFLRLAPVLGYFSLSKSRVQARQQAKHRLAH